MRLEDAPLPEALYGCAMRTAPQRCRTRRTCCDGGVARRSIRPGSTAPRAENACAAPWRITTATTTTRWLSMMILMHG